MLCYIKWQKEIKVADGIKVANHIMLKSGYFPGLSRWGQCYQKGLYEWKRKAEEEVRVLNCEKDSAHCY